MDEKLKKHVGDLTAKPGVVYQFTEITGYIDARGADTKTAFPKLTTVGGSIDARGADTKTAFPKLTTVGGYIDASGDYSKVRINAADAADNCRDRIFQENIKNGYFCVDGIVAILVSRKGNVARVIVCGKTEMSYVVGDGLGNYSHGNNLDEARSGLIYKLSSRDTTSFKKWTTRTVVTLAEAVRSYRAITGACEAGARNFCEGKGDLPKKLTIQDAIKLTVGKYGAEVFAKFFAEAK